MRSRQEDIVRLEREIGNLVAFISQGRSSDAVSGQLAARERELATCRHELQRRVERQQAPLELPSADELRRLLLQSIDGLARERYEFSRQLRKVIPRIVVFPYRLVDSDKVVLRAKFRVHLSKLLPSRPSQEALALELDQVVEINLYEPPQREAFRERIVAFRKQMTVAQAAACGITTTAAQYALKLQRVMNEQGLVDPYVPVSEPPAGGKKLRRHKHSRYRFDPMPDAGQI